PSSPMRCPTPPFCRWRRWRHRTTCVCACWIGRACWPTSRASSRTCRSPSTRWCKRSWARAKNRWTSSCSRTSRLKRTLSLQSRASKRYRSTSARSLASASRNWPHDPTASQDGQSRAPPQQPRRCACLAVGRGAAVKYSSTRGGMAAKTFCEVLLEGLAPDGGLVVPDHYPQVTLQQLSEWRKLSYAGLAFQVFRLFADDVPEDDLRALVE